MIIDFFCPAKLYGAEKIDFKNILLFQLNLTKFWNIFSQIVHCAQVEALIPSCLGNNMYKQAKFESKFSNLKCQIGFPLKCYVNFQNFIVKSQFDRNE